MAQHDPRISPHPHEGKTVNSYGPPPEFYKGLTPDERIEIARQVTLSKKPREPKDDD